MLASGASSGGNNSKIAAAGGGQGGQGADHADTRADGSGDVYAHTAAGDLEEISRLSYDVESFLRDVTTALGRDPSSCAQTGIHSCHARRGPGHHAASSSRGRGFSGAREDRPDKLEGLHAAASTVKTQDVTKCSSNALSWSAQHSEQSAATTASGPSAASAHAADLFRSLQENEEERAAQAAVREARAARHQRLLGTLSPPVLSARPQVGL